MTEVRDITGEKREKIQQEELISMMVHDMKSPLTVINGTVQSLHLGIYGRLDARMGEAVKMLERGGKRLLTMVEELLDAYRLESGRLNIQKKRCNLGEILELCYNENSFEARKKQLEFRFERLPDLLEVKGDELKLCRVFNNLIGNAVKFTPRQGVVKVREEVLNDTLVVTVEDTGVGIPRSDLPRIFNKFYRSDGVAGTMGTGLGLAISRAIVEAHGGAINVESAEGVGSRFQVLLPKGHMADEESIAA
jgi:signal transduction histidine kinase